MYFSFINFYFERLSGSSPFLHHTDPETTKANITFCRLTFDEFYDDVTGEAVLFIQQCLKRSPRYLISNIQIKL